MTGHGEFSSYLKTNYIKTRFLVEDDQWPPEQPKHFTPLVLVHQEGRRSKKETTEMASATMKGKIEQYLSTTGSKTTKDLQEVLSQLEQSSNSEQPRTLLVEGSPGIGKSVLLKQISYLWARNELLTNTGFLFLLHLRDPAVQEMKSLECLVRHFYNQDKEAESHLLLQDGGKSVTVLLDGYDELPANLRQNSFIARLLQHKVLPASAVVVSSRPHASTRLRNNVSCRVEILGFSEEDQTHFIQQSLEGQEEKISHLSKYFTTHPTIVNLCFVPFNMTILLFIYQQAALPTRSSDLYKLFICLTICRHLAKSGITLQEEVRDLNGLPQPHADFIKQLSQFAFKALNKDQLVFSLAEITEHFPAIVDHPNGFGLLQTVEYVGLTSRTRSFNFIHFSVQEFLAAHYIAIAPSDEQLYILETYFWSDIHYNMFNFYVALTSGQSPSFKQLLRSGNEAITIDDKFLENKLQRLRFYRIFYEAGDISTCKTIEEKFTDKEINLPGTLSPNNLEDLTTLLTCSSCRNWKNLDLNNCHIQDYGLRLLHRSLHHSNITIDYLMLKNNDLSSSSDSSLSDIIITCKVKVLNISDNKAVGETPHFFTTILTHPSCVIEVLYMHYNNYSTTRPVMELFSSLRENKTVKVLGIRGNNILDDVCGVICDVLCVNHTLRKLYMWGNSITGQASQLILDALKNNNTLKLLVLPFSYPEDIKKEIRSLQQVVNEKRRRRGCDVKLEIGF